MKKNISKIKYIILLMFLMFLGYSKVEANFIYQSTCTYVSLSGNYTVQVNKSIYPSSGLHSYNGSFFDYFSMEVVQYSGVTKSGDISGLEKVNSYTIKDSISKYENGMPREKKFYDGSCSSYMVYKKMYDDTNDVVMFLSKLNGDVASGGLNQPEQDLYNDDQKYKFVYSQYKYMPSSLTCNYKNQENETKTLTVSFNRASSYNPESLYEVRFSGAGANASYFGSDTYSQETYVDRIIRYCPTFVHFSANENNAILTDDIVTEAIIGRNKIMGGSYEIKTYELNRTEEQLNALRNNLQADINKLDEITKKYEECVDSGASDCGKYLTEMQTQVDLIDKVCFAATNSVYVPKDVIDMCNNYLNTRSSLVGAGIIDVFRHGCSIISENLKDFINWILNLIKIAGPVVVLLFGSMDFAKAVMSSEADANKKAFDKFTKRLIMAAIILLIPTLIQFVFSYFDVFGFANGIEPSNIFCL